MSQKKEAPLDLRTKPLNNWSKLAGTWASFQNLLNNPDDYFTDIMMMVGLRSLEDLSKCRQVCQSWYAMISQMTKESKRIIKIKAASDADNIKNQWVDQHTPLLPEITTAASLAHHGLLRSVEDMRLENVNLASVPAEHLASLASIVTRTIDIDDVRNCDLSNLLGPACCETLGLGQSLSSEETWALKQAMEQGVERVEIWGDVSMDIETLSLYNGQGRCWSVFFGGCDGWCDGGAHVPQDIYTVDLKDWARKVNWKVETDVNENEVCYTRNFYQ